MIRKKKNAFIFSFSLPSTSEEHADIIFISSVQVLTSLYQFFPCVPVNTRDQRPITRPQTEYFILICASSLWALKRFFRGNAPHTLNTRRAPHWFSCCLISAVARYFPTSKATRLLPQPQLSRGITCSTVCWLEVSSGIRRQHWTLLLSNDQKVFKGLEQLQHLVLWS